MMMNQEQQQTGNGAPLCSHVAGFRIDLNDIIKRYADKRGYPYRHVWNIFYSALHDHLHFDVRGTADALHMKPLDYIEQKRLADTAMHVAEEIFGRWL